MAERHGGVLGEQLAYRYGVRVAADDDQADGFVSSVDSAACEPSYGPPGLTNPHS